MAMFADNIADGIECPAPVGTPLLSILIPVHNVADYLVDCVESIMSQIDGDETEIILLDDASTDGSKAVAEQLCARYPGQVALLGHDVNQGLSAARNTLLGHARGRYVWFVDSDDRVMAGAIPTLSAILRNQEPDVVICDYSRNGVKTISAFAGKPWSLEVDREALVRGVFTNRMLHAWLKIWRRELWRDDLRFPIGRAFEDVATTPHLLLRASSYFYVPRPWIYYRFRPDSILSSVRKGRFDGKKHDDFVNALIGLKEELATRLPDAGDETRFRVAYFVAKEFTKIGYRLLRSSLKRRDLRPIGPTLQRYCTAFSQCSPIAFDTLASLYWRRGMIFSWMVLRFFLSRAHFRSAPKIRPV